MRKFLVCAATAFAAYAFADLDGSYILPRDHAAIQYDTAPVHDRVAALQERLRSGKVKLEFRRAARVPRRGAQGARRAGLVAGAGVFEDQLPGAADLAADGAGALLQRRRVGGLGAGRRRAGVRRGRIPRQGVDLLHDGPGGGPKARIDRRDECLQCHARAARWACPGLVVRSVFVERSGMPLFQAGGFVTDHRSPLAQRWGGWYVTGTHGAQRHMGNVFAEDRDHPEQLDREKGANVTDLKGRIDTGDVPEPAQRHRGADGAGAPDADDEPDHARRLRDRMALHEQQAINKALSQAEDQVSEARGGGSTTRSEALLKYMLFTDEAPLDAPVEGHVGVCARSSRRAVREDKRGGRCGIST